MSFPILSLNPTTIAEKKASNTISVEFDGGYKQTRERNTRDLKKFTVSYPTLPKADKDLILAHLDAVRGSTPFAWVHADTNITYSVRYADMPTIKADAKMPNIYAVTLKMEEV
ncbi:MAG: phage tail protein [Epsilonproteobacteria bacterium]|nr:phage tail protein [Campylobacterota bacterium]